MSKFIDLIGKKYNRLTVLELASKNKQGRYKWLCKCDCGNVIIITGTHLVSNHTKSCGCLKKEVWKNQNIIHGMTESNEYELWRALKSRCLNKNIPDYKRYGGRGITICNEWINSFETFYKDMGDRPKGLSLDRIDNNGNYCKENCRWATDKQQARNTRKNRLVTYKGKTKCLAEWAERLNINYKCLWYRINSGWSIEKAFTN